MLIALVDTNVWVSSFINPTAAWLAGRFDVALCDALLDEIADVMRRPRVRKFHHLSDEQIDAFLGQLAAYAIYVEPTGDLRIRICRDRNDDIVLETAILADATYLVTRDGDIKGDRDLMQHLQAQGVSTVSVQQFLDVLDSTAA